jgi:hypothetical protein
LSKAWLRRPPRLRLLHAALIALLLFVQHGALNHALLHVAGHGAAHAHEHPHDHAHDHAHAHTHDGEQPSGGWTADCGFDLLYIEVFDAVPGSAFKTATGTAGTALIATGRLAAAATPAVPYNSRAPPAFS